MKQLIIQSSLLLTILFFTGCKTKPQVEQKSVLNYVDPFIGTGFHGHTFPGATVPFGMVQVSPDTHIMGWEASSGYHYPDSVIYGFSHTHLSGTGIGDMGDVLLLPFSGEIEPKPTGIFKKDSEKASPGYYAVTLDNYGVEVELTATKRVGLHKYSFSNNSSRKVLLDLGHILQPNWGHRMVGNEFRIVNETTIEGIQRTSGWAAKHQMAYRIEFSEPVVKTDIYENGELVDASEIKTKTAQIYFSFKTSDKPLMVKVALSPVDPRGAGLNMTAEMDYWNFDKVVAMAREEWTEALQGVEIFTDDEDVKTNFYTALYHTMMSPFTYQDVDGRYIGMNKEVMQAPKGYTNYTVFSLWDTFRAFHPLMTIIRPGKATEWAHSLIQKYHEGGILPKWPLASNYTGTMVGYPAVSVIADAAVKGLLPDALPQALEAAEYSSVYQPEILDKFKGTREAGIMRRHVFFKEKLGFVPADSISESVSWGLEMAYFDWCVAQIAKKAGDSKTTDKYLDRSSWYKKYFDTETGLMRGRMADGSWRTPFRPKYSSHQKSDYVEGTAWQWSFAVPQDVKGMIGLHGSKKKFESMLDTLFTTDSSVEGEQASGDITGLIGQYAHGNEPSHHMAYLYNWTDAPWKGQGYIDEILYDFYLPTPEGIIGNEDCGQMSAWYVLSAIGIYQVCPGDPTFALGRPIVDKAVISVPTGKFTITVNNNSRLNKYIKEVTLNGKQLNSLFITYGDIMGGGSLYFVMTSDASEAFVP